MGIISPDELRAEIEALPELPGSPPRFSWEYRRLKLRRDILNKDVDDFTNWPTAREFLVQGATKEMECKSGQIPNPTKDWTLNNQLYHLKQLQDRYDVDFAKLTSVYEFGSGYGKMIEALRLLGYEGAIISHDFPELTLLQRYFLDDLNITYTSHTLPGHYDLFIANCSLSEIFPRYREEIQESLSYDYYETCYQTKWKMWDNVKLFSQWRDQTPQLEWTDHRCRCNAGMRYLIGGDKWRV